MKKASSNRENKISGKRGDGTRRKAIRCVGETELTESVASPGVGEASFENSNSVETPTGDLSDSRGDVTRRKGNEIGGKVIGESSSANLPLFSPTPNIKAVLSQSSGMSESSSNILYKFVREERNECWRHNTFRRIVAKAQLTDFV